MRIIKTLTITVFLCLAILSVPIKAQAAQEGIQISPLTYKFEIKPGESQTASVTVKNLNSEPLDYVTEAENFSQVSDDGAPSFSASQQEAGLSTLAGWITFNDDNLRTIASNNKKVINFTIKVPADAEPGGHYAAVFIKQVKKSEEGRTEIGISSRVGTLVLVSVPGEVKKAAEISEFNSPGFVMGGPVDFTMKVRNTGTIHFDSKGTIDIKSLIGKTTSIDMGTHTVIPNNARNFEAKWSSKYPIGRYVVTAKATDADGKEMTKTAVIWALPLIIVIPAIVIIAILILLIKYIKKNFKFVKTAAGNTGGKPADNTGTVVNNVINNPSDTQTIQNPYTGNDNQTPNNPPGN